MPGPNDWLTDNADNAVGMDYLEEKPGERLLADGRKTPEQLQAEFGNQRVKASLSGPTPRYGKSANGEMGDGTATFERTASHPSDRQGMGGSRPAWKAYSGPSPEQLADAMLARQAAQNQAQMDAGPSVQDPTDGTPKWLQDYAKHEGLEGS